MGTEDNICWIKHNHKKFEANLNVKCPQKYLILFCHYKSNNMAHEWKFKQLDEEAKQNILGVIEIGGKLNT